MEKYLYNDLCNLVENYISYEKEHRKKYEKVLVAITSIEKNYDCDCMRHQIEPTGIIYHLRICYGNSHFRRPKFNRRDSSCDRNRNYKYEFIMENIICIYCGTCINYQPPTYYCEHHNKKCFCSCHCHCTGGNKIVNNPHDYIDKLNEDERELNMMKRKKPYEQLE